MFSIAALINATPGEQYWRWVSTYSGAMRTARDARGPRMTMLATGRSLGLLVCTRCRATVRAIGEAQSLCPRCEAPLHVRRPHSLSTTAALVITAAVLYIPANLLPVMNTHEIFSDEDDTILSGVISLAHQGSWPIALLVFFASIVVPLLKLVALGEILFAISRGRVRHTRQRSRMFRMVEFVGRWSMLDVFALSFCWRASCRFNRWRPCRYARAHLRSRRW